MAIGTTLSGPTVSLSAEVAPRKVVSLGKKTIPVSTLAARLTPAPSITVVELLKSAAPKVSPAFPDVGGASLPVAYTQAEAESAGKVPVTLIAAGVGALAVGAFVVLQLRKKR